MTCFDNATLANVGVIDPMGERLRQLHLDRELVTGEILAQHQRQRTPSQAIALVRFIILQGKPVPFPGAKSGPIDLIRSPPVFAILVVTDRLGEP